MLVVDIQGDVGGIVERLLQTDQPDPHILVLAVPVGDPAATGE